LTEDEHRDGRETVAVINLTEDERCDGRENDRSLNNRRVLPEVNETDVDEMEEDEFVFPKPLKAEEGKFY
jgi:hypothetical protein